MIGYLNIIDDNGKYGNTGRFDFSVSGEVCYFTPEEIKEFRNICVVALRVADNMWMHQQELNNKSQTNPVPPKGV